MTPVVPCSITSICLIPGTTSSSRKSCLSRCSSRGKSQKLNLSSQRFLLPLSTSVRLFPQYRCGFVLPPKPRFRILSATGADVVVGEPDSPAAGEGPSGTPEVSPDVVETNKEPPSKTSASATSSQPRRSRPSRKSEMPPIKNEDLVPGATFTGKVRSIQPFGAFIDFGAFADGLVHVSRLSDSYVKDVASVVSVGQEVKVRLVEVNTEAGRISLTMRESDDSKSPPRADTTSSSDRPRPPRRSTSRAPKKDEPKKSSKFVKGQELEGTVKNLIRAGAFISLPEGEEGFLPQSEEPDDGFGNIMGESSLQAGQEVRVRVLRISRGQVTLTMKAEEDLEELDKKLIQGVVHTATNPFVIAFRKNKDIAAFLDESEKLKELDAGSLEPETSETVDAKGNEVETASNIPEVQDQAEISDVAVVSIPSVPDEIVEGEKSSPEVVEAGSTGVDTLTETDKVAENIVSDSSESMEAVVETPKEESPEILIPEEGISSVRQITEEKVTTGEKDTQTEGVKDSGIPENIVSGSSAELESGVKEVTEEVASEILTPEGSDSSVGQIIDTAPALDEVSSDVVPEPSAGEITDDVVATESKLSEEAMQIPSAVEEISSVPTVEDEKFEGLSGENGSVASPDEIVAKDNLGSDGESEASGEIVDDQILSSGSQEGGVVVEKQIADDAVVEEQIQAWVANNETNSASPSEDKKQIDEPVVEEQSQTLAGDVTTPGSPSEAEKQIEEPVVEKQIQTPVAEGETTSATPSEDDNQTDEPVVEEQIQTPFAEGETVSAPPSEDKKLENVSDLSGQSDVRSSQETTTAESQVSEAFVASRVVSKANGSATEVNGQPKSSAKAISPTLVKQLREETGAGMMDCKKALSETGGDIRLEELALLEQPYIKNDKTVVKDWVKQTIATIGENIKVKRFVRFNLGEGLEKKSQDFAAEVAAQTAAKAAPAPKTGTEQPAAVEAKEAVEKPKVAVSAAFVKQLREETGAGMMDCKKALSESGGDLEKAQDYLRKKGLSTADKKSSRLAAEGRIGSYIHDSRIGVLIEVNCETDFVGRNEKFKELVDDLAMQVVACPQVQYVAIEDVPEEIAKKEKELEMQREDLLSKPENIRERIVEGRVSKRLGELALLEQPFIKDDSVLVKDLVKQTVAALGENIKVRRFIRFTLGETTDATATETTH
ncbi:Translation elongation factor EFTs/EF1B, dimerization [Dillenia turbinata]|uniref:Elongation factor Ts, mitochondrial n=1 Tax=Dillenia turbinata TaxID=194707 RepID=A0AAN8V0E7_9MAGN